MIVRMILVVKLSKTRFNDSIRWRISAHVIEIFFIIATYDIYYYFQLLLLPLAKKLVSLLTSKTELRSTKNIKLKERRGELLMPTKLINFDECCGKNDIFSRSSLRWIAIAQVYPHIALLITFIDQHFILMIWEDSSRLFFFCSCAFWSLEYPRGVFCRNFI